MAGDWIKVESVMPDKPEVDQIAKLLSLDNDAVVGKLIRVWIWADGNTINGNDVSVTKSFIDRITYCAGFADALEKCGWLTGQNGAFIFPNFARHNGQTAKARALTNRRVAEYRKRKCNARTITKNVTREEKRRDIVSSTSVEETGALPAALDFPDFRESWDTWIAHRKEKKKPLTPLASKTQLKHLAEIGKARAIAAINHSIANCYQGIYEPTSNGRQGPAQRSLVMPGQVHPDEPEGF